jgi:streptomycin 6-kinase
MFEVWLAKWDLVPDGVPIVTPTSRLLPVRQGKVTAMLKLACHQEEARGNRLMVWWNGVGVARVLAAEGDALLMERAADPDRLAAMARTGQDDEAIGVLCAVAGRLHAHRAPAPPELVGLEEWFAALAPAARTQGGLLQAAADTARALLDNQREIVALHGDLHHRNVLNFHGRGWLAIDPKGLLGERTFDHVNMLRNPDLPTMTAPGRFSRQARLVAGAAALDHQRLLRWTLAFAGLSASWHLEQGGDPEPDLTLAQLALAELGEG